MLTHTYPLPRLPSFSSFFLSFFKPQQPNLKEGSCGTELQKESKSRMHTFNIKNSSFNYANLFYLWLLCLVTCLPQPVATGAVCEEPAVEQLHLALTSEYTVLVMWNSTHIMTPSVRFSLGTCTLAPSKDQEIPVKDPGVPPPSWRVSNGSYNHTQIPGGTGYLYRVSLSNLERDSTYCYAIGDTSCEYSERKEFRTPKPGYATVAALSDAGTWGNVSYIMQNLAEDNEVTLVLHPGDLAYGLKEDVWDAFGRIIEPVASSKPYMVVPGNWDVKAGGIGPFLERYSMPLANPLPQVLPTTPPINFFYSFNYSVFHFVMLSSYDDYQSNSTQYKWLEKDLIAANKDRKKRPWIVVSVHSPMYSSNSGHNGGDEVFRLAVEPLLIKYHVDLVLTGHDHGYERSYPVRNYTVDVPPDSLTRYHNPQAPIHILVGTAGATLDEWMERPTWSAHREASFGYTKLYATRDYLSVSYSRQDNSVGDQFSITKGRRLNLKYVIGVVMVCVFSVLPLLLYKGLPTPIRNFLLCKEDGDDVINNLPSNNAISSNHIINNTITTNNNNKHGGGIISTNNLNKWV